MQWRLSMGESGWKTEEKTRFPLPRGACSLCINPNVAKAEGKAPAEKGSCCFLQPLAVLFMQLQG